MKDFSDWFTRLDDRMNPLVVKDTRQALNSRALPMACLVALGAALFLLTIAALDPTSGLGGLPFFYWVFAIATVAIVAGIVIPGANRWSKERNAEGFDPVAMTVLSPAAVARGKLFSVLGMALYVYSLLAPFMVVAYLLRGIALTTIFQTLYLGILGLLPFTQLTLLAAAGTRRGGGIAKLVVAVVLIWNGLGGVFALFSPMFRTGFASAPTMWLGVFPALSLGLTALLFVATVEILTPKSANRMFPFRIALLLMFALLAGILRVTSRDAGDFWTGLYAVALSFAALTAVIACEERDEQTRRVLNSMPRNRVLHVLYALLSSGAGAGFLNALGYTVLAAVAFVCQDAETRPGMNASTAYVTSGVFAFLLATALAAFWGGRRLRRYPALSPLLILLVLICAQALGAWLMLLTKVKNPLARSFSPFYLGASAVTGMATPFCILAVVVVLAAPDLWRSLMSNWKR